MERVTVTRYVTPLREGGSLPGIVEADDLGTYVCKFRGAGQGPRVLVAEVVVGALARAVGLHTPRLVALDLPRDIARYEADEEVQDLLVASVGLNLGIDFLPGAFGYDGDPPGDPLDPVVVLWLDAFTANVDRSWRNPNLLVWHDDLWVIDHGASLYFHHAWSTGPTDPARFAAQRWDATDHVLGAWAGRLDEAEERVAPLLDDATLRAALDDVPDEWLAPEADVRASAFQAPDAPVGPDPAELREAYVAFLTARLGTRQWLPGGGS